jgi:hypothetical protein
MSRREKRRFAKSDKVTVLQKKTFEQGLQSAYCEGRI